MTILKVGDIDLLSQEGVLPKHQHQKNQQQIRVLMRTFGELFAIVMADFFCSILFLSEFTLISISLSSET